MLLHKGSTDHFQFFIPNQRKVTPIDSIVTAVTTGLNGQRSKPLKNAVNSINGSEITLKYGQWLGHSAE